MNKPLLQFAFFVDDVDISFIHDFERRFLGDEHGVWVRLGHQDCSCLTMPKNFIRVSEQGTELNISGSIIKIRYNRLDDTRLIENLAISHF